MKMCKIVPVGRIAAELVFINPLPIRQGIAQGNVKAIIDTTAAVLMLSPYDLIGNSQKREIVDARYIAMHLILRYNPKMTLRIVGKVFTRNHATVIHARATVNNLLRFNKYFKGVYEQVNKRLPELQRTHTV